MTPQEYARKHLSFVYWTEQEIYNYWTTLQYNSFIERAVWYKLLCRWDVRATS